MVLLYGSSHASYGYMAMYQCLNLISDLKLGLYMKIPPRKVGAISISTNLNQYSVLSYFRSSIYCSPEGTKFIFVSKLTDD